MIRGRAFPKWKRGGFSGEGLTGVFVSEKGKGSGLQDKKHEETPYGGLLFLCFGLLEGSIWSPVLWLQFPCSLWLSEEASRHIRPYRWLRGVEDGLGTEGWPFQQLSHGETLQ